MAYIDEGNGDAIVFQHGQPTSSFVWRNVMPHLEGMGRLIACDLIGMGNSDKLDPSLGPDRYSLASHRNYLFDLWDRLNLGNRVVLVLDDWGAVLGFDWARQNSRRVRGIVHMEAIAAPLNWPDIPEHAHPLFKALRLPGGERMVLEENIFIETVLPQAVIRQLTDAELTHYRSPFRNSGEDRRPMLSWPRSLPIDGEPAEVTEVVSRNGTWLSQSDVPKLFINGEPGTLVKSRLREIIRQWPNQTEVTVKGRKLLQEDSPDEIGAAIANFIKG
jgi:haloalkane dehalogenase